VPQVVLTDVLIATTWCEVLTRSLVSRSSQ
jgi:hypothetical protein